jgi:A/G-specific adenine glycosylase
MQIDSQTLQQVIKDIADWFILNGRKDLPWRKDQSPYRVWVSEIMLQQTRIEAVIPHYLAFMQELPDVAALASVPEERLLKLWQGLGYYSRARNLKLAATQVMERYGGTLPSSVKELQSLAGIGAYTAGAISSVAYGMPEPAVDGNVLRVIARLFTLSENVMDVSVRNQITQALRTVYPTGKAAGYVTEGLMELGEVVCIPNGVPLCEACPVQKYCQAFLQNATDSYPVRVQEKQRKSEQKTVFLFKCQNTFAVRRRPPQGLLASLWEFPNTEGWLSLEQAMGYADHNGLKVISCKPCGEANHLFTHIEWHLKGYFVECANMCADFEWKTAAEIEQACAVPSAFKYYLRQLKTYTV